METQDTARRLLDARPTNDRVGSYSGLTLRMLLLLGTLLLGLLLPQSLLYEFVCF